MIRPFIDPAVLLIGTLVLLALVVLGAATAPRGRRRGWLLRALMVLLLAAIALRPGWGTMPAATRPSDLEVLLVVDRTTSMSARDWHGDEPRLEGVRSDAAELMAALPAARFTVVTFGKQVSTVLPSTSDAAYAEETLGLMQREEPFSGSGSLVDRPLHRMEVLLERMGQEQPERRRLVVLMTDGENTASGPQASFAPLAPLIDGGAVLGYGSGEGGLMPLDEDGPPDEWVIDPATGEPARSRIDEDNLRAVAQETGLRYLHRRSPGGLAELAAGWQRSFTERADDGSEAQAQLELGWLLALLLLAITAWDLRTHWRGFWQARRELA